MEIKLPMDMHKFMDEIEKDIVSEALDRANGNITQAAKLLGLNRTTLVEKRRKLGFTIYPVAKKTEEKDR